jgi:hypothetical protein
MREKEERENRSVNKKNGQTIKFEMETKEEIEKKRNRWRMREYKKKWAR